MKSKIKTVEDAFKYTGRELSVLDAFENLPERDKTYMAASYKRMVVIEALNKEANGGKNWTPDWSNSNEYKYYSWVWLKKNPAGVGFVVVHSHYGYTYTNTTVGSRLCLKSSALVEYLNEQFADLIQITIAE